MYAYKEFADEILRALAENRGTRELDSDRYTMDGKRS